MNVLLKEVSRRRLAVNRKRLLANDFVIGDSFCQMYAVQGRSEDLNRTVTRSMIFVQYVFSDNHSPKYVYTENGRITAWQDLPIHR
jgi:hypothetical protein